MTGKEKTTDNTQTTDKSEPTRLQRNSRISDKKRKLIMQTPKTKSNKVKEETH